MKQLTFFIFAVLLFAFSTPSCKIEANTGSSQEDSSDKQMISERLGMAGNIVVYKMYDGNNIVYIAQNKIQDCRNSPAIWVQKK